MAENTPEKGGTKPEKYVNKTKNFAYFKSTINLADFLESKHNNNSFPNSYYVKHKESTRANPKFKKFNKDDIHVDTVGVFKGDDNYYYVKSWDTGFDDKAVNIYDFLISELSLEGETRNLTKVHNILKDLESKGEIYSSPVGATPVNSSPINSMKRFEKSTKILSFF